jgi:hypothetical protein
MAADQMSVLYTEALRCLREGRSRHKSGAIQRWWFGPLVYTITVERWEPLYFVKFEIFITTVTIIYVVFFTTT